MINYILLAILNGIFIGVSRVLIGRLSMEAGPFKASFWSYVIGFLFTTVSLIILEHLKVPLVSKAPFFAYLGGFFGALYVVINAYAFTKLGATQTVLLVISGQMISGILIDYQSGTGLAMLAEFIGVVIILFGVYLAKSHHTVREVSEQQQVSTR